MSRLKTLAASLMLVVLLGETGITEKRQAVAVPVLDGPSEQIRIRPTLALADTCVVRHDSGIVWKIDNWVIGNELYKSYLDPAQSCSSPYPFAVTEVVMAMYFAGPTPLSVSADVESVDASEPGCPFPGNLLTISSDYTVDIPQPGLYEIWVPLDSPYVVNGPFFAGFFIGNVLDPADSPAVITDDFPTECVAYNIWDDTIGFVELGPSLGFPGRLVLYAVGIPGGGSDPPPALHLVAPEEGDTLYETTELWAWDTSGSEIIDHVSFEYSSGQGYAEIGRDFDGQRPLRDGVSESVGDGFRLTWDFSNVPEGTYVIRATAQDTLGRNSSDSVTVYMEPTPPIPWVASPGNGDDFCSPLELIMTSSDENLSLVEAYRKAGQPDYSAGLTAFDQSRAGDANGNPDDGNPAANGEYGDYYCGPVAAALAVKLWFDRGYVQLMMESATLLSLDTLVERLAARFRTRDDLGTYDENLLAGLKDYTSGRGYEIVCEHYLNPGYFQLRSWLEESERAVLMALGGNPGVWLAVDGFTQWEQPDGSFLVRVSSPLTGTLISVAMRQNLSINEVYFNGHWQRVDLAVTLWPADWVVSRSLVGADLNGVDGWSISWTPSGLIEDNPYFFLTQGRDAGGLRGFDMVLLRYDCSQTYTLGDYDDDDQATVADLTYLIEFIALDGPAPIGGAGRADANCDNNVNVADLVYYMNYLFGSTGPPCY